MIVEKLADKVFYLKNTILLDNTFCEEDDRRKMAW